MPIYAQATTETTPSEEKGIQQKDNTSPLLPVLLRAVSQLGVLKRLAGYLRRVLNRPDSVWKRASACDRHLRVNSGLVMIQALPANRWNSRSVCRTLAFHPSCETILSGSPIVMTSGRRQSRKSVCASELNAWFDRNQLLTNYLQESKNPRLKWPWGRLPPGELPWRLPSLRELSWRLPSSPELSWRPPSLRELSWRLPS